MKCPTKEQVKQVLDRRQHTLSSNLRLLSVALVLVLVIGLFLPLFSVSADLSVTGSDPRDKRLSLLSPAENVLQLDMKDLLSRKPLEDYELYGRPVKDYQLFGLSLYDLLLTPLPDYGILVNTDNLLSGEWVNLLTDPGMIQFCVTYLGDFGKGLVDFCGFLSGVLHGLQQAVETSRSVVDGLRETSEAVQAAHAQVEQYKSWLETAVTVLFLLMLAAVAVFLLRKGPRFLPGILLAVGSFVFVAMGIGAVVANGMISAALTPMVAGLNETIHSFFDAALPTVTDLLRLMAGTTNFNLHLDVQILCGAGYWLITLSLLALTALAFFVPAYARRREQRAAAAEQAVQEALPQEGEEAQNV